MVFRMIHVKDPLYQWAKFGLWTSWGYIKHHKTQPRHFSCRISWMLLNVQSPTPRSALLRWLRCPVAWWGWRARKGPRAAWRLRRLAMAWLGGGFKYFLVFSPRKLGKMNPFWQAYFSKGLVQPPISWCIGLFWVTVVPAKPISDDFTPT